MGKPFQNQMKAEGHKVIDGKKFVVVKHGDELVGVDPDGEPIELDARTIVYAPKAKKAKIFHGSTAADVKSKINGDTPDDEIV